MKISEFIKNKKEKYKNYLIIVKKWIFWITIDEDAFFMAKEFNMKITKLDKQSIKIGFPDNSKDKWFNILKNKKFSFVVFNKINGEYKKIDIFKWSKFYRINLEDYNFTKQRILWLAKLDIEEKNEKNFLLKDKLEDIYIILLSLLMKIPKKERYFLREKIEKLFLDLFEYIYKYMYNLEDRKNLVKIIFWKIMVLREFVRFLYKLWKIKNDNIFLDLWNRFLEVLKICKWIIVKSKHII